MKKRYQVGWITYVALAAMFFFGLILVLHPYATTRLILNVLGYGLLAFGAVYAIRYYIDSNKQDGNPIDLAVGAAMLVAGILVFVLRSLVLSIIPVLTGLFLIVSGIAKLKEALDWRGSGLTDWKWVLIACVISIIMGAVLVFRPFTAVKTVVRVIGSFMIVESVQDLLTLLACRKHY